MRAELGPSPSSSPLQGEGKNQKRMTIMDARDPSGLEEILASIDPMTVRMAHDYLTDAAIESYVFDAASSRMLGTTAGVPVRLMVPRDAAQDARECLNELGFTAK